MEPLRIAHTCRWFGIVPSLTAGLIGLSATTTLVCGQAAADAPSNPSAPLTTAATAGAANPSVDAIRKAADPSAAVSAFAAAQAAGRGDARAEEAYVRRMTEFGLPEMADAQAQDLIRREPANGPAWGVAAYMSARRGDLSAAASQAAAAVRRAPDDPFVQRTAAQVVAWFDAAGEQGPAGEAVHQMVDAVRQQMADEPAYAAAYQQAKVAIDAGEAPPPDGVGAPVDGGYAPYAAYPAAAYGPGYVAAPAYGYGRSYAGWSPGFYDDYGPWYPYGGFLFVGGGFGFGGRHHFYDHDRFGRDGRSVGINSHAAAFARAGTVASGAATFSRPGPVGTAGSLRVSSSAAGSLSSATAVPFRATSGIRTSSTPYRTVAPVPIAPSTVRRATPSYYGSSRSFLGPSYSARSMSSVRSFSLTRSGGFGSGGRSAAAAGRSFSGGGGGGGGFRGGGGSGGHR